MSNERRSAPFAARPVSARDLEGEAERILRYYFPDSLAQPGCVDILGLLERLEDGPERVVFGTRALEPGLEAYTDPERHEIIIDYEGVYLAAMCGDGHARQTCAHEVGHIRHIDQVQRMIQHFSQPQLNRAINVQVPIFQDPEWQAHHLGGALLMPRPMFVRVYTEGGLRAITECFGVSRANAESRARALRRQHALPT